MRSRDLVSHGPSGGKVGRHDVDRIALQTEDLTAHRVRDCDPGPARSLVDYGLHPDEAGEGRATVTRIFWLGNLLPLPFWLLMILLPDWHWTRRVMASPLVAAPPAVVYVALMAPRLGKVAPAIRNPTLPSVATLLSTPDGATVAWLHMMMADLFVGRWIYLDARGRGLGPRLTSPLLVLAMVFSPAALLLYLAVRSGRRPGIEVDSP